MAVHHPGGPPPTPDQVRVAFHPQGLAASALFGFVTSDFKISFRWQGESWALLLNMNLKCVGSRPERGQRPGLQQTYSTQACFKSCVFHVLGHLVASGTCPTLSGIHRGLVHLRLEKPL